MNNTPNEQWMEIPGYEGRYSVSNIGRVKGYWHRWPSMRKDRILKIQISKRGYPLVAINSFAGKRKSHRVHRLVAETFLAHTRNGLREVNHKDGDKSNNSASNLEWCTRAQNVRHSFITGLHTAPRGERCGTSKLKNEQVLYIRKLGLSGLGATEISKKYGVTPACIYGILKRKSWAYLEQSLKAA